MVILLVIEEVWEADRVEPAIPATGANSVMLIASLTPFRRHYPSTRKKGESSLSWGVSAQEVLAGPDLAALLVSVLVPPAHPTENLKALSQSVLQGCRPAEQRSKTPRLRFGLSRYPMSMLICLKSHKAVRTLAYYSKSRVVIVPPRRLARRV
jgi:hypothetical protein